MAETAESVVEQAISAIRNEIREGRYAPGQRLVVADLMETFGISAGPVREAIRRLTGEGLVDIVPNKGATVRKFTTQDLREIFEVREAVEARAAELAAEKIGDGDNRVRLEKERKHLHDAVKAGGIAFIRHNQAFHDLIHRMAANQRLIEIAQRLMLPVYRLNFHRLMDPAHIHVSAAEHERLMDALAAGDAKAAGNQMRRHIRSSGAAMMATVRAAEGKVRPSR